MRASNAKARFGLFPTFAAAALAVALSPAAALASGQAQSAPENHAMHDGAGGHEHGFVQIDKDSDDRISRTEFAAAHAGKSDRFAAIDGNGDGFISRQEFDAHHAAMQPAAEGHAPASSDEHAGHH